MLEEILVTWSRDKVSWSSLPQGGGCREPTVSLGPTNVSLTHFVQLKKSQAEQV